MEIIIKGSKQEIADLISEAQGQQNTVIALAKEVEGLQKYFLEERKAWLKKSKRIIRMRYHRKKRKKLNCI